jgi:hypothetical protein
MAGRAVYKLGDHRLRIEVVDVQAGTKRRQYVSVPILTRCLERTGELLKLDKAAETDLQVLRQIKTRPRTADEVTPDEEEQQPGEGAEGEGEGAEGEIREVIYYRTGSWRADSIRLVYKEKIEAEESEVEAEESEGGQEEGEEQEGQYKIRTLHIPVPSWAPNYKVLPVLFGKARAAQLKVVGAYRNGGLIYMPNQGS